jgi:hypothetical protein
MTPCLGFDNVMTNLPGSTGRSIFTRVLRKMNHHRTTELYLVGYPKTGNTWIRYMLGRYMQMLCNLPALPLFDATDSWGRCEKFCAGPAMQFTHHPLVWRNQQASDLTYENVVRPYSDKRVVLLVRHPLDTLVSHWMQRKYQTKENYSCSLSEFLRDMDWGIEKYFRFYSLWFKHKSDVKDFLLVRYEDTSSNAHQALSRLLEFLAVPARDELLTQTVADSNFESMRNVELTGVVPKYRSSGLKIFATGDMNNPDSFHVRRGKVGGFRDYLEPREISQLSDHINRNLPEFFGYSTSGSGI